MVKLYTEYRQELLSAFETEDYSKIEALFQERPDLQRPQALGRSWLYWAAKDYSVGVIKFLIGHGFDPYEKEKSEGINCLCAAASCGRLEVVRFFHHLGVEMDTSLSVRNPLFAAILSGNIEVVQFLLEAGIDATIKYKSPTMYDLDAASFAMMYEQIDIAEAILVHLSGNDQKEFDRLTDEAIKTLERQAKPSPYKDWIVHN